MCRGWRRRSSGRPGSSRRRAAFRPATSPAGRLAAPRRHLPRVAAVRIHHEHGLLVPDPAPERDLLPVGRPAGCPSLEPGRRLLRQLADVRAVGVHQADAAVAGIARRRLHLALEGDPLAVRRPAGPHGRCRPPVGCRLDAALARAGRTRASSGASRRSRRRRSRRSRSRPRSPFTSIRWNTIRVPSGDQSGSTSATDLRGWVIWWTAEPSGWP